MAVQEVLLPSFGAVRGVRKDNVIQFLGLRYGELTHRFATATMHEYNQATTEINAAQLGPTPISLSAGLAIETSVIQQTLPEITPPPMDGLGCLNLNVTVPLLDGQLDASQRLPVLVFIHGGAYLFGSNWYPHYNQDGFVALSVRQQSPVIAVTINYRLGLPGLLYSEELRQTGLSANRTLQDQALALRWVQKHIKAFGGDANSITVVGQSAGAMSICYHLQSPEPLFGQAILLGGSNLAMGPGDLQTAERHYKRVIDQLGLTDREGKDRLDGLYAADDAALIALADPMMGWNVVCDGETVRHHVNFNSLTISQQDILPGKRWCSRLLAVQGNLESSITGMLVLNARKAGIGKVFRYSMSTSLANRPEIERLFNAYGLSADVSDEDALQGVLAFANDISFFAPACSFAAAWGKNGYVGNLNEGNPWSGPNQGKANHMFDIALLWQKYNSRMSEKAQQVTEAFASDIIRFTTGTDDLPPFRDTQLVTVWGNSAAGHVRRMAGVDSPEAGRTPHFLQLADDLGGLDTLLAAYQNFVLHG